MPIKSGKTPQMSQKKELELKLLAMLLALYPRIQDVTSMLKLPKDLQSLIGYAAGNGERVARMILHPEEAEEYTLKPSKIEETFSYSPENLKNATTHLIYRAFLVGRMANRLFVEADLPTVDWYKEVLELDKESDETIV